MLTWVPSGGGGGKHKVEMAGIQQVQLEQNFQCWALEVETKNIFQHL